MSDTSQTVPPTVDDAAQARDNVEEAARAVYEQAVLWAATHDEAESEPDDNSKLMKAAKVLAFLLLRSQVRWSATRPPVVTGEARDRFAEQHAVAVARRAVEDARAHYDTVRERVQRTAPETEFRTPDAVERATRSTFRGDTAWKEAAARTMATRVAAETVIGMHADVEKAAGLKHRLLWVSRGDPKVRALHRRLHGKTRPPGTPFHTWPDGQELNYPGDPKAPLDATINCRCALLMVPAKDAKHAETVFEVPDTDFDVPVAASGWTADRDRAERELRGELARRYL